MSSRQNAQPLLHSLSYVVFDEHKLVAAFARRDDAEHWHEECGHPAMDLRKMNAFVPPLPSKRARPCKSGEKIGRAMAHRR